MKKILYTMLGLAALCTTACRKYVEIPGENIRELKYTKDYQLLLNNSFLQMEKSYNNVLYSSDEVGTPDGSAYINNMGFTTANVYTFQPYLVTETSDDQDWYDLYKSIYVCNTVTSGVMGSPGGTDAEKRKAYAEAQAHRAYAYHTLVNIYAKQYDAATADSDPGVPLLLSPDLFASLKRASVTAVYNQIEKDIQEALPVLPNTPDVVTAPSKAGAYGLLARVYLHKRNFAEAGRYADSALKYKNSLIDLNAYITATYPIKVNDPEIIFSKTASLGTSLPLTQETLNLFDSTVDLRFSLFTRPGAQLFTNFLNRGTNKHRLVFQGVYVGPGVPEMMLIKAEAEARANNAGNAITILNTLRKKRYTTTGYYDFVASTQADALLKVLNERRRELLGTGLRWFDQRRLQKDAGMPTVTTVTRIYKGTSYTLEPGSPRYVYPIAIKYTGLNPEIEQNPR